MLYRAPLRATCGLQESLGSEKVTGQDGPELDRFKDCIISFSSIPVHCKELNSVEPSYQQLPRKSILEVISQARLLFDDSPRALLSPLSHAFSI